ncbi:MAG: hypothetical protein BMS9Abin36_1300 [Gammaproteobacteria bacterium]|nr:MAG: hypothetical protein BMS9Abin36_1300 [Gammaproteobacteria bacterium]
MLHAIQNPFSLENQDAYLRWRDSKLAAYPETIESLLVEVSDPAALLDSEKQALVECCRKTNMAVYVTARGVDQKETPRSIGASLGLQRLDPNMLADDDGITSLTVVPGKLKRGYIPYSDKRMLWHTDGYYNTPEHCIRALLLHSVRPALQDGENALLDHEIVYLYMRDQYPEYVAAMMAPDAMTIPANGEDTVIDRPARTGPVFSVDTNTGALHMRYTARTRSIIWKDNAETKAAAAWLETFMNGDSPYIFRHKLTAGQGLLCNNVLHSRTAFVEGEAPESQRLLYRARYYDRINGTGLIK